MLNYIKFTIRKFLELDDDYESLLSNQEKILDQLKNLEIQNQELILEGKKENYSDYLTLKNALWLLLILVFLGGGFWFFNSDFVNDTMLASLESLGELSKDLHQTNLSVILDSLEKLNESSINVDREKLKLLLEIKNLLLKKGLDENPSLNRPLSGILQPTKGGIVCDEQS